MKGLPLNLSHLTLGLGLTPPTQLDGWSLTSPGSFLASDLGRLRWWSNSAGSVQALQIELAHPLLDSSVLQEWVETLKSFLQRSMQDQSLLQPFLGEKWPMLSEGAVEKNGGVFLWSRRGEWGQALVLTAGLAPCKQCGAPPGPSAKRCWECDYTPGLLGFLRKNR